MPAKKKAKSTKATHSHGGKTKNGTKVRVRMYRQGLGDCFLITFDPGGVEKHILIDCGSLGSSEQVDIRKVVGSISKTTGDHLNLVVATHEHKDHLSGFNTCKEAFQKMTVDNVWLAWTEDPADKDAKALAKNKKDLGEALTAAAKVLTTPQMSRESSDMGMAVHDLLGFFGDNGGSAAASLGAAKFAETINQAMDFVRTGLKAKTRYHDPGGDAVEADWLPGFRFYILGPPRDKKALDDTGEHGSSELYGLAAGLHQAANFCMANPNTGTYAQKTGPVDDEFEREAPFDVRFRCVQGDPNVQPYQASYFGSGEDWRRVDTDWLHVSADLALQLDSSTNNTSLAMAIERISDGKVLLFPADAQQGNWLSWHADDMQWTVAEGSTKRIVKIGDLLARTVFYKVGHHASHNATAKAQGLELMKQEDELTAFIPVDRAIALKKSPAGSWRMPARPLYLRLLQKCQGRVVRADLGWADQAEKAADKDRKDEEEFLKMGTAADWNDWRRSQKAATHVDTTNPLFMEYTLN